MQPFLMAYQVTGEMAHEWIGMGMTVLVIIHQILNRKWYGALFKGKYNPYRNVTTILNILLLLGIALTAFCGMSMSGYAVPFLYGMAPVSFVRRMHLSMSQDDPDLHLCRYRRNRPQPVPSERHAGLSVLPCPVCISGL